MAKAIRHWKTSSSMPQRKCNWQDVHKQTLQKHIPLLLKTWMQGMHEGPSRMRQCQIRPHYRTSSKKSRASTSACPQNIRNRNKNLPVNPKQKSRANQKLFHGWIQLKICRFSWRHIPGNKNHPPQWLNSIIILLEIEIIKFQVGSSIIINNKIFQKINGEDFSTPDESWTVSHEIIS